MTNTEWRIAVDVGGTFTDALVSEGSEIVARVKVPSTPDDPAQAFMTAIAGVLASLGPSPAELDLRHATTVATNAILERSGAVTGLVTTAGFKDVLELGRLRAGEMYDLGFAKPAPLVERASRVEIQERMSAEGVSLRRPDRDEIARALRWLDAQGVQSIAVCLLHAWASPEHERFVAEVAASVVPEIPISLSSTVLPRVGEYERTSTTVVNAYVQPAVSSYINAVQQAEGLRPKSFSVMQSSGGLTSAGEAGRLPVALVESGPAAAVLGAAGVARMRGDEDCIAFDMGGTTAKAALIEGGVQAVRDEFEVGGELSGWGGFVNGSGHVVRFPAVDLAEVGAGGGSIASVDAAGGLAVGPRSAGAEPGPACYGTGGSLPTVTDANLILGFISPAGLAGGRIEVHADRALAAIEDVSYAFGGDMLRTSWAIHQLANATMAGAIRAVTTRRGRDPRSATLIASGGSGPIHAVNVCRLLGIRKAVIPRNPGLLSAFGLLCSPEERTMVRSHFAILHSESWAGVQAVASQLERECVASIRTINPSAHIVVQSLADVRYQGQGSSLTIPLAFTPEDVGAAFEAEHKRSYGHVRQGHAIEIVAVRAVARAEGESGLPVPRSRAEARGRASRPVFDARKGRREVPVLTSRFDLGGRTEGPLVIDEYDTSVVISSGASASLDASGNIEIDTGATR